MKTTITLTRVSLLAMATSLSLAACGGKKSDLPPAEEGDAYLTIVGDSSVFLDYEAAQTLNVRYHDGNDMPLAGEVSFEVVGDARGSSLAKSSGVTDNQGSVAIRLSAGTQETSFRVKASAPYAASVEWTIAVRDEAAPLEPQGTYQLDSEFDVSDLPGDVGQAVSVFIDVADDPGLWILDQIDDVPNGFAPVVNAVIAEYAPGFVNDILEIGDKLGQAARKFGTVSELEVSGAGNDVDGGGLAGEHTMTGFTFRIDGETYDYTIDELGSEEPVVEGIGVEMDGDDVVVGAHDMPVRYGAFLGLALNETIIPLVDPNASNLHEVFTNGVNCTQVGIDIYAETQYFSASFYEGLCNVALQAAAEQIMAEILGIDQKAPLLLKISGKARAGDSDGDRKVDEMSRGKWNGAIDYNGDMQAFTEPGTFTGERMTP